VNLRAARILSSVAFWQVWAEFPVFGAFFSNMGIQHALNPNILIRIRRSVHDKGRFNFAILLSFYPASWLPLLPRNTLEFGVAGKESVMLSDKIQILQDFSFALIS
jgi:hypothetical protein